ncbi:MAG TPA: tripartite tricarboxylate transporter TctB family protein [Noviherbaspirillum sp.]|nr:tripartite tricarboxylate transporter TctB family protein [Noviherbaspirillum sp.]
MTHRNYKDILGGLILVVLGLFVAYYSTQHYQMGTLTRMGPGAFPRALGYLLAGLGVLILVPAFFRSGTRMIFDWRPFLACATSILVFAITVKYVGMIPAIVLLVVTAALADDKLSPKGIIALAIAASILGVVIFSYGFEMSIPLVKWGG